MCQETQGTAEAGLCERQESCKQMESIGWNSNATDD